MSIGREIILLKSRIAERKKRRKDNERRADTLTRVIREIVDPLGGDFVKWDIDQFQVLSADLIRLHDDTVQLDKEISLLEKELDG